MRHFNLRIAAESDLPFVARVADGDVEDVRAFMGRAVTLMTDHGVFFFEPITSSVFEAHMAFLKEGRGSEALHSGRAALHYAFCGLDAAVIFARAKLEDRPTRLFTRMLGLKSDGIRPSVPGGAPVEWFEARRDHFPESETWQ